MMSITRLRQLSRYPHIMRCRNFSSEPSQILCAAPQNKLFRLTLNREKKLNSLSLDMMLDIDKHYDQTIPKKSIVWFEGAGPKAFCAGGDVAAIVEALGKTPRDTRPGEEFFWHEYRVDYKLASAHESDIVNVAVWDGIVMGGGVGVGYHAPIRLVTETTMFAMPETNIGLFPDVGMTWALSRLNGTASIEQGRWLGLTGARLIGGADCLKFGIGTHYVEQKNLDQVFEHLAGFQGDVSTGAVSAYLEQSPLVTGDPANITISSEKARMKATDCHASLDIMKDCFSQDTLSSCIAALKTYKGSEFAQTTLATLAQMSPVSLRVSWEAINRHSAKDVTLRDALKTEYRMACHCLRAQPEADFQEGVAGLLIEKRKRTWSIAEQEDVPTALVDSYFAPLRAGHELGELPI